MDRSSPASTAPHAQIEIETKSELAGLLLAGLLLAVLLLTSLLWPAAALATGPEDPEGWVEVKTAHFRLLTDAGPERGSEIVARLELFRGTFARLAPSLELRSPAPTTLFAFRDARSYAPYKSRADRGGSRVLGQFAQTRDGNYLTLDAGSNLADAFTVIYHEYVHFLVVHNFPRVPLWFNEGLAEYYSTFAIEGVEQDPGDGRVRRGWAVLGDPVERHRRLLADRGDFSLDEVIAADTSSSAYHAPGEAGRFYALSWALVHYLLSGGSDEMDRTVDYFLRLEAGEDSERAFEGAFERYLSTMESELRTYLETGNFATAKVPLPAFSPSSIRVRSLPAADVLVHLGDLLIRLGRARQADAHFFAALERDPEHADAHAGLAHVRDLSERWGEAEALYRDAVRLRSRSALTYLLYGRHSLAFEAPPGADEKDLAAVEAASERARQSLERAVALHPDFGEAHALLALAHSRPGGDLDAALRAVDRAHRLLPRRLDLVSLAIQVHLRREDPDQAARWLRDRLEPYLDEEPDRYFEAEEAIDRTRLVLAAKAALEADRAEEGLRLFDQAVAITSDPALREKMENELLRLQAAHAEERR